MTSRTKLELTWIGKENRPRLEPRILLEDPQLSYHAPHRVSENDLFDNRLIFGDNLLALKALEQEFSGKIKCIYIDPPYNTGSAFEHYDDGLEHSLWLTMMRDRLELLRQLLSEDGSIWMTIDDNEAYYLKVHGLARTATQDSRYKNFDNDPRGPWASDNLLRTEARDYAIYPLSTPSGKEYLPPKGTSWRFTKERMAELVADNRIWFGESGSNMPRLKRFLTDVTKELPPSTWWPHEEAGHNSEAKKEILTLFPDAEEVFSTPKPERLLKRVVELATQEGDWVLDSFAGSGTTGAVAHKMGRRWIMVELGEHCHTHIIPRLKKVINGEDTGGITQAVNWKGGGGFRYFRLAPSLLEQDKWGNWVINKEYDAAMLIQAMCKHEGFTYAPSETVYWQHGHSTERDFLYVTTQTMTREQLALLDEEVGADRSLLICCTAFRAKAEEFPNLTIKKIPKAVLSRCEFGRDDYSLQIAALPAAPIEAIEPEQLATKPRKGGKSKDGLTGSLFEMNGGESGQ